jgi:hypothetical protein
MGDSRIAEGFSARSAALVADNRIRYWNFGIGGSTPRIWYYMLRDGDPTRRRFAAIVIPLDGYADQDKSDSAQNRLGDLNYAIGRLRWTDCVDFAFSMRSADFKARALSGCLFKGIPLRRDAQEFLRDIPDRIRRTKEYRMNGLIYIDDYGGQPENLHGLTADLARRTIHFPPGLNPARHAAVQAMVLPAVVPQTGELSEYRKLWLGRILDLYKDSRTRIVFLELPRGPIPQPESQAPPAFLRWALTRPRVSAIPQGFFRDLERPEVYYDGLHLNKTGRALFSERLAGQVQRLIEVHK